MTYLTDSPTHEFIEKTVFNPGFHNSRCCPMRGTMILAITLSFVCCAFGDPPATRVYENRLTPIRNPKPLLADYPEFVQPIVEQRCFEAPVLVDDDGADLDVRAWRYSYNARGIIEMPNRLRSKNTAVIVVHPWGIDDSQGWRTPEPAGVCDMCTPDKNRLSARHTKQVIDPLLKRLRSHVELVMYSLPYHEQPVQAKLYRSIRKTPTEAERGRRPPRFETHPQQLPLPGRTSTGEVESVSFVDREGLFSSVSRT